MNNMNSVALNGLSYNDIDYINSLPDGSTIVFRNTVGIDKEAMRYIKPNIIVRIIGGLDEVEKPKFNTQKYYNRTLYKPMEVYKIIEKMETIEKAFKPDWNDLDKAMYIYQTMCENMDYDHIDMPINGRDYNRNLLGFLRGQSVCAGFSMMYKEMLERQGIRCIYQNKQHGHAWNLIEINGRLIPVDLTFDIGYKEGNGKCNFAFFGRNENFFKDPNHIATDEKLYSTSLLTDAEFNASYEKVVEKRNVEKQAQSYVNARGEEVFYHIIPEGKYRRCILYCNGIIKSVVFDDTVREETAIHYDYFAMDSDLFVFSRDSERKQEMNGLNDNCIVYYRDDGTSFMVRATGRINRNLTAHDYISFNDLDANKISINKIVSEDNLARVPSGLREGIANILLSRRRVYEKTRRFKGYVGYLGMEKGRYQKYYNPDNEKLIAGFTR